MSRNATKDLTTGSPMKLILGFGIPLLFGMLFQQFYSTVDAVIVGQFVGADALAAVGGSAAVIVQLVVGIFTGLSSGATVVISHGGGIESVYSNLAELPTVEVGQSVSKGDTIGSVGTTALCEAGEVYHLHFAMRADGQSVDPGEYLPQF